MPRDPKKLEAKGPCHGLKWHWLKRVEIPTATINFDEISHHSLQGKGYNEKKLLKLLSLIIIEVIKYCY